MCVQLQFSLFQWGETQDHQFDLKNMTTTNTSSKQTPTKMSKRPNRPSLSLERNPEAVGLPGSKYYISGTRCKRGGAAFLSKPSLLLGQFANSEPENKTNETNEIEVPFRCPSLIFVCPSQCHKPRGDLLEVALEAPAPNASALWLLTPGPGNTTP